MYVCVFSDILFQTDTHTLPTCHIFSEIECNLPLVLFHQPTPFLLRPVTTAHTRVCVCMYMYVPYIYIYIYIYIHSCCFISQHHCF